MNLSMGSNVLRNTNGVFTVKGNNQIVLEIGETDGELLLTMDLYDPTGAQFAQLHQNTWVSNNEDRFVITKSPKSIVLTDTILKDVVIEGSSNLPQCMPQVAAGVALAGIGPELSGKMLASQGSISMQR